MTDAADELAPIVVAIDLEESPDSCYLRFTTGFSDWWPVLTHSLSRHQETRCVFEPFAGGRVFETTPDGTVHLWGTVTATEQGRALRFSWHPGREPATAQWVAVRFEPSGHGCRVTLTHGGWEALGEIAPIMRREYLPGWQHVFGELYGRYAGRRH